MESCRGLAHPAPVPAHILLTPLILPTPHTPPPPQPPGCPPPSSRPAWTPPCAGRSWCAPPAGGGASQQQRSWAPGRPSRSGASTRAPAAAHTTKHSLKLYTATATATTRPPSRNHPFSPSARSCSTTSADPTHLLTSLYTQQHVPHHPAAAPFLRSQKLFNYISGSNAAQSRIEMTAPVVTKVDPGAGLGRVGHVLAHRPPPKPGGPWRVPRATVRCGTLCRRHDPRYAHVHSPHKLLLHVIPSTADGNYTISFYNPTKYQVRPRPPLCTLLLRLGSAGRRKRG